MEKNKQEIRSIVGGLSIREAVEEGKESRTLTGRAIVFNSESEVLDDWGYRFREVIKPEACTQEFIDSQDIKINLLHDRAATIGRKNEKGEGNLKLEVREDGVYFEIEVPKCDLGDRALELVRSGVYTGCSFEFYPDQYTVEERGEDDVLISHTHFAALTAITVGMDPAYKQTSVNARELVKHDDAPAEEPAPVVEEEKVEEAPAEEPAPVEEAPAEEPQPVDTPEEREARNRQIEAIHIAFEMSNL